MRMDIPEKCSCGTTLLNAPGIGPFCPNKDCPICDGPFDGSEPVKLDYSQIFIKGEYTKKLLDKIKHRGITMAHTGMEKEDFEIGKHFWTGSGEWICTDIGTKVIVAIKYDDDDEIETVFNHFDFGGCSLEPFKD